MRYSSESLAMAIDAVISKKLPVSGAARTFQVPETTLYENLKRRNFDVTFVSHSALMYYVCV